MEKQTIFDNFIDPCKVRSAFVMWLKPRVGIPLLLLL